MQCVDQLHSRPTFTKLRRRGPAFTHELVHRSQLINPGSVIREIRND